MSYMLHSTHQSSENVCRWRLQRSSSIPTRLVPAR